MGAMAWTSRAWSRSHRRNHGDAGSYSRNNIAGNAESDASSRWTRNLCMPAVRYHHLLCDGQAARGANLHGGHRKHGAMAGPPPDERPAADALDATRRAFDAQGSMRGDEPFPPARSCRRRRARAPSFSPRGMTPEVWDGLCGTQQDIARWITSKWRRRWLHWFRAKCPSGVPLWAANFRYAELPGILPVTDFLVLRARQ